MLHLRALITTLFVMLLAGAGYFALERILFADASFILFRLINHQTLQIQEHRYGSFITQSLPLIASKMQLPIQSVVLVYSLSFNLFYLAIAALLLYRFRQVELAVLMAFYFTLFVSDTYFWVNNEVHQGIAWMFLLFAFMRWSRTHRLPVWALYGVFTLLSFLTLYTHPLLLFPTGYLFVFLFLRKELSFSRSSVWFFTFFLLGLAISKILISTGGSSHYDAQKLEWLTHPSIRKILDQLRSPLAKEIVLRTMGNYWMVPIIFAAGMVAAVQAKKYWTIALTIGAASVYVLALCLTFQEFTPFYMESELMPLSIILSAPFVFDVLPKLRPGVQTGILVGIFTIRLLVIYEASWKWTERKNYVFALLDQMRKQNISKGLVDASHVDEEKLIMNWGTPAESILASSILGDQPHRSFVVDYVESLKSRKPVSTTDIISSFEIVPASSLNKRYFQIDTSALYQYVPMK